MTTRAELALALQASLQDSAKAFGDDAAVFGRCVDTALQAYTRLRPHRLRVGVSWRFGGPNHAVPPNTLRVAALQWTDPVIAQWMGAGNLAPPPPPQAEIIDTNTGLQLHLSAPLHGKAPSAGTVYVTLHAPHVLATNAEDTTESTVPESDADLLLLRAQVEALRELSNRGITKPVALRDGYSQGAANGTPAALYERMLAEWRQAMRD